MLEAIHAYYPIALILLLIFGGLFIASLLSNLLNNTVCLSRQIAALHESSTKISQSLDTILQQTTQISNVATAASSEVHALASHFVPRLRTEWDVSREQWYQEECELGIDPASKFWEEREKSLRSTSNPNPK